MKPGIIGIIDSEVLEKGQHNPTIFNSVEQCDMLEVRFDTFLGKGYTPATIIDMIFFAFCRTPSDDRDLRTIHYLPPLIATVRLESDGGFYPDDYIAQRIDLWKALMVEPRIHFIDVEYNHIKDFPIMSSSILDMRERQQEKMVVYPYTMKAISPTKPKILLSYHKSNHQKERNAINDFIFKVQNPRWFSPKVSGWKFAPKRKDRDHEYLEKVASRLDFSEFDIQVAHLRGDEKTPRHVYCDRYNTHTYCAIDGVTPTNTGLMTVSQAVERAK